MRALAARTSGARLVSSSTRAIGDVAALCAALGVGPAKAIPVRFNRPGRVIAAEDHIRRHHKPFASPPGLLEKALHRCVRFVVYLRRPSAFAQKHVAPIGLGSAVATGGLALQHFGPVCCVRWAVLHKVCDIFNAPTGAHFTRAMCGRHLSFAGQSLQGWRHPALHISLSRRPTGSSPEKQNKLFFTGTFLTLRKVILEKDLHNQHASLQRIAASTK